MKPKTSKVRTVDPRPSDLFVSENGTHIPKSMTYKQYCYYSDEGLTIQEIKFADAYTQTPDLVAAAMSADIEEHIAKAWGKVAINKPQVKRRIEDNLAMARRSSVAGVRERKELLTSIMRATITDCLTVTNGKIEIDLEKAKKHGSHKGIVSIKIDDKEDQEGGSSRSRSLQMANPMSAVSELNKMESVYDKAINRSGAIVIIPAEDCEL
jgi:phage terminase small subunit